MHQDNEDHTLHLVYPKNWDKGKNPKATNWKAPEIKKIFAHNVPAIPRSSIAMVLVTCVVIVGSQLGQFV